MICYHQRFVFAKDAVEWVSAGKMMFSRSVFPETPGYTDLPALFRGAERVQRVAGADEEIASGNRGCGPNLFS